MYLEEEMMNSQKHGKQEHLQQEFYSDSFYSSTPHKTSYRLQNTNEQKKGNEMAVYNLAEERIKAIVFGVDTFL